MYKRTAHRHYTHHLWYRQSHPKFRIVWRKFAEGVFLGGWLFLLGVLVYTHLTQPKLIDPSKTYVKSFTIEKPTPTLDTRTHITYISKITVESPTVAQVNPTRVPLPKPTKTPVQAPHTAPANKLPNSVDSPRADIEKYIDEIWGKDAELGKRIAQAESGINNNALNNNRNGTWDYCAFQINSVHGLTKEYLSDYKNCVEEAYKLFKAQGTGPWNSSRRHWSR